MFCSKCGSPNDAAARFCAKCGQALAAPAEQTQPAPPVPPAPPPVDDGTVRGPTAVAAGPGKVSGKNPTVALVLSIFLGALGAGQIYNGDWKKGLVMAGATVLVGAATGGLVAFGVWVWSMVDAWQVASGKWSTW